MIGDTQVITVRGYDLNVIDAPVAQSVATEFIE
jgi:hypothetical protein